MFKKSLAVLGLTAATALSSTIANAGKIVVANDEWTLSNVGYSQNSNTGTFVTNVANWFTGGGSGNFLAYSTNFGLTGSSLANTMTSAGHGWTTSTAVTFDVPTLLSYDAVFLAGNPADNQVLIDYVNAGGDVYLAGGTGVGGPANEAARWNTFLNNFGLSFGSPYNGVGGNVATVSSHPIFNGVSSLYNNNGNNAIDLNVADPASQILVQMGNNGLYGVYEPPTVVPPTGIPSPPTLLIMLAGLFGLLATRRK